MALHFAKERSEGPALVRNRIVALPSMSRHPLVHSLSFDTQQLGTPHEVYELHLSDIARGKSFSDSTHLRAHRYLIHASGQPTAAAEVIWSMHGHGNHYVDINIGPFVMATARAFSHIETHEHVKTSPFAASFLRCRALCLFAIWLKSKFEGSDQIYFLPGGAPSPYSAEQLYALTDFEVSVQAMVQNLQSRA